MRAKNRTEFLLLAPAGIFLFILPFPHTVALRLLCLFASFIFAIVLWRRLAPPPLPLQAPLLLWGLVVLLSLGAAVDLRYSIRELQNELGYTMIAFVSLFVLVRDERALRLLCLPLVAGFFVISLSALAGYAWLGEWPRGAFYGGFGTTSNYFVTATPAIALGVWLWRPAHVGKWFAATILVYLGVALIALQRSLWPALAAQVLVGFAWLWSIGKISWSVRRLVVACLVVLGVGFGGLFASEQLRTHADLLSPDSMLKDMRPRFWLAVGRKIAEHPLMGAGFGQRALVKAYPELVPPENSLLWHAHNLVLNYGVYAGIPGIVAILILFAALFRRFWRLAFSPDRDVQVAGLAGAAMVAGVFVRNTFNDFFIRDGALLFWALAGMLLGYALRRVASGSSGSA